MSIKSTETVISKTPYAVCIAYVFYRLCFLFKYVLNTWFYDILYILKYRVNKFWAQIHWALILSCFSVIRTFGKTFLRESVYVSLVIHVRAAVYPCMTPQKEGQGNGS